MKFAFRNKIRYLDTSSSRLCWLKKERMEKLNIITGISIKYKDKSGKNCVKVWMNATCISNKNKIYSNNMQMFTRNLVAHTKCRKFSSRKLNQFKFMNGSYFKIPHTYLLNRIARVLQWLFGNSCMRLLKKIQWSQEEPQEGMQ